MSKTEADTTESPYRTMREVAAYFRVSTKTVQRWIAAGLPSLNIGGGSRPDHRLKIDDVERFLRSRSDGPPPGPSNLVVRSSNPLPMPKDATTQ